MEKDLQSGRGGSAMNKQRKTVLGATVARWRERGFISVVLVYPILLFIVFYIVVNFNSFILAFQKVDVNYNYVFTGFDNFKQVFADLVSKENRMLSTGFINSGLMFLLVTGIGMPLNLLFGYMIYRKWRGTGAFRLIVMLPSIISGMLMALMFQKLMYAMPSMMKTIGVDFPSVMSDGNYVFGTTVFYSLWTGFGTAVIMYPNIMGTIDNEIIEAGRIDGCNSLQELWHIIIPLIFPTIATFMVTGVAGIFNNMGPNYTFWDTSAPPEATNIGYLIYAKVLKNGVSEYGYTSALGMICTLIAFPITLLVKYIFDKADPVND